MTKSAKRAALAASTVLSTDAPQGRGQTLYGYDPYSKHEYRLNVGGDPTEARKRGEVPLTEFSEALNAKGLTPLFIVDDD